MKTITIKNLKAACSFTRRNNNWGYTTISVDITTGELFTDWHYDQNSWTEYHDRDIVCVCTTHKALTMADIKTAAEEAIAQERYWRERYKD